MPIFLRKYGFLILPALVGGAVALGGVGYFLYNMWETSLMGEGTFGPKGKVPAPVAQKGAEWNLGR